MIFDVIKITLLVQKKEIPILHSSAQDNQASWEQSGNVTSDHFGINSFSDDIKFQIFGDPVFFTPAG